MARRRSSSGIGKALGAILSALFATFVRQNKSYHTKRRAAAGAVAASPRKLVHEADDDEEDDELEPRGFNTEVVGESHYKAALRSIFGPGEGRRHYVAWLVPDPENKHDPHAVRVLVRKQMVGHLSRSDALKFRARFGDTKHKTEARVICREGGYGVWLNLDL